MTTLDTLVSFAERVEASTTERKPIDWRRLFLALLSALPYVLGRVAGHVVYGARIMASAAREGYRAADAPAATRGRLRVGVAGAPSTMDA